MPGQGRVVERPYTLEELVALGETVATLGETTVRRVSQCPHLLAQRRLVKKFVRHFDRVARPEYGLTRPCYTNYSGSTRLRVIADQYRNRPTILRLPKMNTASRRPDRPQNQNESSVPSRYRTRLSANAAKKSIELQ